MKANRYTKRLDGYQHLVIMLYAVFSSLNSLRELEIGFLSSATRMNYFGLDYMVRRNNLSDANARRKPDFIAWLLMRVVQQQTKRKWSMSNLLTAVRILVNSYIGLYTFLDSPEKQWLNLIGCRPDDDSPTLFEDLRGPNLESQRTVSALQALTGS